MREYLKKLFGRKSLASRLADVPGEGRHTDESAHAAASGFLNGGGALRSTVLEETRQRIENTNSSHPALQVAYFLERNAGGQLSAAEFFAGLADAPAARSDLLYKLGDIHAKHGDPERALAFLGPGIAEGRFGVEGVAFTARQYARVGNFVEAARLLDIVRAMDPGWVEKVEVDRQFCDFLACFPRAVAERMLSDLLDRSGRATWQSIEADALAALRDRRGYLQLRLGDGEGSCLIISDEDARTYAALYAANRQEFYRIWFDDDGSGERVVGFDRAIRAFNEAISLADCIGGIYREALVNEYQVGSRRGISYVVNSIRKVESITIDDKNFLERVPICGLTIHYEMLITGGNGRLISAADRIGLISCHADLAPALERKYGKGPIEFIKVPGEQIHADELGETAVEGRHWPERFDQVCALCADEDRRGQLFLVAAGLLGKVYAAHLKRAGAVVLDIGAVADLWMGKSTRDWFPTVPEEHRLM